MTNYCVYCHRKSLFFCHCGTLYCSKKCQKQDYINGHKDECIDCDLIFDASGFLIGISHYSTLSKKGTYTNKQKQQKIISGKLTDTIFEIVQQIIWNPLPVPVIGRDVGHSVFKYGSGWIDTFDSPALSELLLSIDPGLSKPPGGLRQYKTPAK